MGLLKSLAPIAGAVVGNMIAPGIGGQIGGALGGAIAGGGGGNVQGAYNTAAGQQQQYAQNAQFRPVGVTTNFGQSQFQLDPATGQLVSAGYGLNPQLQGLQTSLLGGFAPSLAQAQGVDTTALQQGAQTLYGLGQGYLGQTPQEVQQNYVNTQLGLLRPEFEQATANLRNRQFATGRGGLATGGTISGYGVGQPGLAQTNPEQAALANAYARAVANITAQAPAEAQRQITFGSGLLTGAAGLQGTGFGLQSAAYDPFKTQLGLGTQIEAMGQQALGLGSELGGKASSAAAQAGQLASQSAQTGLAGQIAQQGIDASRQTALQNQITGLFGGGMGGSVATPGYAGPVTNWFSNLIGNPSTAFNYGTNLGSQQTAMLAAQDFGF
jgi:hypothetical protein